MDSILDALQEGRLFELPENDKTHALQFLAHIIEAFPQIPAGTDIVGTVMSREQAMNTAIGKGWACPHARVDFDEDLVCVIGWSPHGIDYGAPDGQPVYLIIMYLVPSNQRNHYLREISILAKALKSSLRVTDLPSIKELNDVRNFLLDLISESKETSGPDARARMIRLQTKQQTPLQSVSDLSRLIIEPVSILVSPGSKPIVLTQNQCLMQTVESSASLPDRIETEGVFQNDVWRIVKRNATTYQGGRTLYDCLAFSFRKG
jgi:Phosphotransferase system mannitol/fructose-specific IIA domain (Ntr-type)